jgi:hypothetical protein
MIEPSIFSNLPNDIINMIINMENERKIKEEMESLIDSYINNPDYFQEDTAHPEEYEFNEEFMCYGCGDVYSREHPCSCNRCDDY